MVVNGPQVLLTGLDQVVLSLASQRSDVALVSYADGTPSGLMLVRCGVLRGIAEVGFIDMKEQGLPQIAREHAVSVVERATAAGMPVRGLTDYITALRAYHRQLAGKSTNLGAFTEDWQPTFRIIERGAQVDPSARVHDAVVLRGGEALRGSVSVRSVICPLGVANAGETYANQVVTRESRRSRGKRGPAG